MILIQVNKRRTISRFVRLSLIFNQSTNQECSTGRSFRSGWEKTSENSDVNMATWAEMMKRQYYNARWKPAYAETNRIYQPKIW
jgi:hypothetical protein